MRWYCEGRDKFLPLYSSSSSSSSSSSLSSSSSSSSPSSSPSSSSSSSPSSPSSSWSSLYSNSCVYVFVWMITVFLYYVPTVINEYKPTLPNKTANGIKNKINQQINHSFYIFFSLLQRGLDDRTQRVGEDEVMVKGIERTINSYGSIPDTWQSYFLPDG